MEALSDRGSTPLASTIHSHVQWDINKNRTKAIFTAYVRLLFVQGRTAIEVDVSFFRDMGWAGQSGKNGILGRIGRKTNILSEFSSLF